MTHTAARSPRPRAAPACAAACLSQGLRRASGRSVERAPCEASQPWGWRVGMARLRAFVLQSEMQRQDERLHLRKPLLLLQDHLLLLCRRTATPAGYARLPSGGDVPCVKRAWVDLACILCIAKSVDGTYAPSLCAYSPLSQARHAAPATMLSRSDGAVLSGEACRRCHRRKGVPCVGGGPRGGNCARVIASGCIGVSA